MKKLSYFLLCAAIITSLCACANKQPEVSTSSKIPQNHLTNAQDTHNTSNYLDSIFSSQPSLLATDHLSSISDISDMRYDGSYLVYGIDYFGNDCYGIWYPDGAFEVLDTYRVYFALADGHFLATNDTDLDRGLRAGSYRTTDIPNGRIIDKNEKVLFEATANQRLHIINSSTVFIVEATSGFEGKNIRWGLLDQLGNWQHSLDDTGEFSEFIEDYIFFENEKGWSYDDDLYITSIVNCENRENTSLQFWDSDEYANIIFNLDTDSFFETQAGQLRQVNPNEWIWEDGHVSYFYSNNRKAYGVDSYRVHDHTGQSTGSITDYHTTINGVKYWVGCDSHFDTETNQNIVALSIRSDKSPEGYAFPPESLEQTYCVAGFMENQVFMVMEGADGLMYFVSYDMNGTELMEPILLNGFKDGRTAMFGNYFVCYDTKTLTLYTLNPASGDMNSCYLGVGVRLEEMWDMGNSLFAISYENNDTINTHIFTMDAEQLF